MYSAGSFTFFCYEFNSFGKKYKTGDFTPVDVLNAVLFFLVCAGGSAVQAVCGFGFVSFVMMFFPYIFPSYQMSVVVAGILAAISGTFMAFRLRRDIKWKRILAPVGAYFVISAVVILFSSYQPDIIMIRLLAVSLILLSVYFMFIGSRLKTRPTVANGIIAGSLGGLLGGFFSVSGPPVALYMVSASEDNNIYMANIQGYFAMTGIYSVGMRVVAKTVTTASLGWAAFGVAAVLAGIFIGRKIFYKLNPEWLRRSVYIVMAVSGITMLFKK